MPMMATTSISSIRVKPDWDCEGFMTTGLREFWNIQCRVILTGNCVEFQTFRNPRCYILIWLMRAMSPILNACL